MNDLGQKQSVTTAFHDSQGAIESADGVTITYFTRRDHIEVRYNYMEEPIKRNKVSNRTVNITHIQ